MATMPKLTVSVLDTQTFRDYVTNAEAVAARLVEVICEQNLYLAIADSRLERVQNQRNIAWNERDAARAEVAALPDEVARLEARWLARTPSYGALRDRREVLADLRAKVEGLYVRCTEDPWRNEELADWVRRDAVLALIDEASNGCA